MPHRLPLRSLHSEFQLNRSAAEFHTTTGWAKKNRYGHFHSYLTTALEFFDTLNMKMITNKFLINFEWYGVNRLDVICSVRIECKNSTLGAEISTFSEV